MDQLVRRQQPDLDACQYVSWDAYNWYDLVQCNLLGTGIKLHWNPAVFCIIAAAQAISGYIALSTLFQTLTTFKSWRTLYFWSLMTVCVGLILQMLSLVLMLFVDSAEAHATRALSMPSVVFILTGFPLVLYSRLRILIPKHNTWLPRTLLAMIIVVALGKHTPQIAAIVLGVYRSSRDGYTLFRRVRWLDFATSTEIVFLSGLYIHLFRRYMLEAGTEVQAKLRVYMRTTFYWIIFTFIITVMYEATTLTLMSMGMLLGRYILDVAAWAIKLNIELFVLDRVVYISKLRSELLQRGNFSMNMGADVEACTQAVARDSYIEKGSCSRDGFVTPALSVHPAQQSGDDEVTAPF